MSSLSLQICVTPIVCLIVMMRLKERLMQSLSLIQIMLFYLCLMLASFSYVIPAPKIFRLSLFRCEFKATFCSIFI